MDAGDPQVEPRQQLVGLVERAVVEDVDLDPLEQGEAGAAEVLVDGVDDVELAGQPLGAQAVGDGQPGRVVGEHEVVVAELDGRERHLLDRRAAVGPVGVGVQVTAQPGAEFLPSGGQGPRVLALDPGQSLGPDAAARFLDHRGRARAHPGQLGQGPGGRPFGDLVGGEREDRRGRRPESLDLVGVLAAAFEQERDPPQRGDRAPVVGLVVARLDHTANFLLSTSGRCPFLLVSVAPVASGGPVIHRLVQPSCRFLHRMGHHSTTLSTDLSTGVGAAALTRASRGS